MPADIAGSGKFEVGRTSHHGLPHAEGGRLWRHFQSQMPCRITSSSAIHSSIRIPPNPANVPWVKSQWRAPLPRIHTAPEVGKHQSRLSIRNLTAGGTGISSSGGGASSGVGSMAGSEWVSEAMSGAVRDQERLPWWVIRVKATTPATAMIPPRISRGVVRSPSIQWAKGMMTSGVSATTGSTIPVGVVARAHW